MENLEGGIKRKSRLAVFEHVVENRENKKRKKFQPNRLNLDDSSPSESELVIDDDDRKPVKKRSTNLVRLTEEPLNLICEWMCCFDNFFSWKDFNVHLIEHATETPDDFKCRWRNCGVECHSTPLLIQHVSYHSYLTKLKNIGQNVLNRNELPECTLKENYIIPICPNGYTCYWEHCSYNFCTIYDFYTHMDLHIKNNPRVSNERLNEIIKCHWEGCNTKYSSQYKLAEHLRTHTKEKTIACPTCCCLFSNKTKFCDHRKRQLGTDLQSYQCSQCLKLFPTERLLRDHIRSHINHYKCTMCDMTCPKPSVLAKHMRYKHVKYKPFKCTHCEKSFVAKHNLDTHLKTHIKEKLMKCDLCKFKCRTKIGLETHYTKEHNRHNSVYKCHCCNKKFKRGAYLTKHLMKKHNYHWPSGHTRFRYRKDQDNVYSLQTVRYESLEVTQEMIRSETMQPNRTVQGVTYSLKYDNDRHTGYVLSVMENGEQSIEETAPKQSNVLITINDVDEHGNILRSEVVESQVVNTIGKTEIDIIEHPVRIGHPDIENVSIKMEARSEECKPKRRRRKKKTEETQTKTETYLNKKIKVEVETDDEPKDIRHFSIEAISNDMVKIEPPVTKVECE